MKIFKGMALLMALACLVSCAANVQGAPELLEPVGAQMDTAQVVRGEIFEQSAYEFFVAPHVEEVLHEADGTLAQTCVTIGQQVEAGDVLLRLDVDKQREELAELDRQIAYTKEYNDLTIKMLELDVEKCAYELTDAADFAHGTKKEQQKIDEFERVKTALEQEKQTQELQMQQLYAQREELEKVIARSELTAPVSGSIVYLAHLTTEGIKTDVRAGDIAVMIATEELHLKGDYVSEAVIEAADEIYARVGTQNCAVEYMPMDRTAYISMLLSGAELTTEFAFADGVPEGAQAGDYALVLVKTRQKKGVLHLPVNAVERDAQGDYVYRVTDDGGRERVNVTVGYRNATAIEIEEGLEEGDVVYVP